MLKADGSNWVHYKSQVEWAIGGQKGLIGHLYGTKLKPTDPSKDQKLIDDYPDKLEQWETDNGLVKQVMAAPIPESVFL
ncbi:hypothetical protein ID866_11279 [Astraeus odoratus]|nr:hypothetical protein ID866_11279 [Astraeus odoratus]